LAGFWSAWRISSARIEIRPSEIQIRNVWRNYRVDRADICRLRVGYNVWLLKTGVIETCAGKQIRPWALLLGRKEERSDDELRAVLKPVGVAIGLDRID
jgi:hypothetical protein